MIQKKIREHSDQFKPMKEGELLQFARKMDVLLEQATKQKKDERAQNDREVRELAEKELQQIQKSTVYH